MKLSRYHSAPQPAPECRRVLHAHWHLLSYKLHRFSAGYGSYHRPLLCSVASGFHKGLPLLDAACSCSQALLPTSPLLQAATAQVQIAALLLCAPANALHVWGWALWLHGCRLHARKWCAMLASRQAAAAGGAAGVNTLRSAFIVASVRRIRLQQPAVRRSSYCRWDALVCLIKCGGLQRVCCSRVGHLCALI